ncbi:hypothetical protein ACFXAZ_12060 [Streptomyces sp. NPDC059477]|uniref:hypothetical protein n=1 Tax=Streptomyces sp. NPDC059477 TaxID=3346847 RepID=UPI0036CF5243
MTTIPRDLTLTVRRGPINDGYAAYLRDVRPTDGTAVVVYDRHLANPGTAVWLARLILRRHGCAVREVALDAMGPDITALFREASRLRLNIELGSTVAAPRVITRDDGEPASYLVPAGWSLTDATERLAGAHAEARPDVVRALRRIEGFKREHGDFLGVALDTTAGMILESGNPTGVWDSLARALALVDERAKVPA